MKSLGWICLSLLLLTSCNETPKKETSEDKKEANEIGNTPMEVTPGNFVHSVFFWLKRPDNKEDKTAFLVSLRKFIDQSPHISNQHIGSPAATNREVIDNTYTFSLLLTFADKKAQDAYQDEAAHKTFIAESSELWEKVLVYDSELLQE